VKLLLKIPSSSKERHAGDVELWPCIFEKSNNTGALFRYEKILDFATVALSFVCGKYYPIID